MKPGYASVIGGIGQEGSCLSFHHGDTEDTEISLRILLGEILGALRVVAVNAKPLFHRQDAKDAKKTPRRLVLVAAMLLRTTKPKMFVLLERIVSGFSWDRTHLACTRETSCTLEACGPRKPRYPFAFSAVNSLVAAAAR